MGEERAEGEGTPNPFIFVFRAQKKKTPFNLSEKLEELTLNVKI